MPVNFMPTGADYLRILPEIILTVAGTLIMVLEAAWWPQSKRNVLGSSFARLRSRALVAAIGSAIEQSRPGVSATC